jgi:hypothetical protein
MTKTLFLALFYSALFPSGLFLTCLGYSFCYVVDKYSLLRQWRTPAQLDDDITKVSRGHLVFGIYCHAVMTMIFYAEFPFDNVCLAADAPTLEWWRYRDVRNAYNVYNVRTSVPGIFKAYNFLRGAITITIAITNYNHKLQLHLQLQL